MKFLSILSAVLAALALANGYPQKIDQKNLPEDQQAEPTTDKEKSKSDEDDNDMYMEAIEQQTEGTVLNESPNQPNQAFYPSFSPFHNPPLGHSRPFYYQPEAAYSHRPSPPYQQQISYDNNARFTGYKDNYDERSDETGGILGSGNFGVIKGGTFYNDNDDAYAYGDDYSSYYQNGHGRPSFYDGNPQPRQYQQFENFRDFADINTPTSPAYSHFVVVYANKNATDKSTHVRSEPKNIIERLAMLDMEGTTGDAPPTKKGSHSKRKLALLLPEKKTSRTSPVKRARDVYEPLLALS